MVSKKRKKPGPKGPPYTAAERAAIEAHCLQQLREGHSMKAAVASLEGVRKPHSCTVEQWAVDDPEGFGARVRAAREAGWALSADEIREIADEKPKDQVEATWQRTRIDTIKWLLAKRLPKQYGDRTHVEHSGKLTLSQLIAGSRKLEDAGE